MAVLIHFLFQIIKISILGSFYATIVLFLFVTIGKISPESYFGKRLGSKMKIWWSSGFVISVALFLYMFTYWGNHGLGDSARIPIGNFKEVGETDGVYAYIEPENYQYGAMPVHSFAKSENFLVGKSEVSPVDRPKSYFCWNLEKDEIIFYNSEVEYNSFARKKGLPKISEFKTFRESYREYWGGMKFWLLP